MAIDSMDWGVLMLNHPHWWNVRKIVTNIPAGWETCCIQLSHALNKAGGRIRNVNGNVGLQQGGDNFIIRVPTMRDYLDSEFEDAENYQGGDEIAQIAQIVDRTGIIAFGDRHIDLWNKTNIQYPTDYIRAALWKHRTTLEKGIFFWEIV